MLTLRFRVMGLENCGFTAFASLTKVSIFALFLSVSLVSFCFVFSIFECGKTRAYFPSEMFWSSRFYTVLDGIPSGSTYIRESAEPFKITLAQRSLAPPLMPSRGPLRFQFFSRAPECGARTGLRTGLPK